MPLFALLIFLAARSVRGPHIRAAMNENMKGDTIRYRINVDFSTRKETTHCKSSRCSLEKSCRLLFRESFQYARMLSSTTVILTRCRENLRNSGSDQHEPCNRNPIQQCCPRAYRCQASDERAKHQRRKRNARRPDAFEYGEFLEVRLLLWNRGSGRRVFPSLFSHLDLALLDRLLVFALAPA